MKKYYPYKSDKPNKKYYIITNDNKKVYFGQASASDFTIHARPSPTWFPQRRPRHTPVWRRR